MKYARVAALFLVARTLERATTRWQVTSPCAGARIVPARAARARSRSMDGLPVAAGF